MNMPKDPLVDEHEWQAQERGMRAARAGGAAATDHAATRYRVVAQAVRSMPLSQPPADFASSVACVAAARADAAFERLLSRALLVIFAISALAVAVLYGAPWWQLVQQAFGADALPWLLIGIGCLGLSWAVGELRAGRLQGRLESAH